LSSWLKNASTITYGKTIFKKQRDSILCELNPPVLIIHGPVGSGKSNRAEQITNRALTNGYKVYGVISRRVLRGMETIGYDAYFPHTGETRPMVYKEPPCEGVWEPLRGPFKYNRQTFEIANEDMVEAAHLMDDHTLVVADEYGHLEARGFGLYPGLLKVVEALPGGGRLLIPCRTDKVDNVLKLFAGDTKVLVMDASQPDFWTCLGDSFI
jgi:nucleoside-triphosphatase THEP1